MKFHPKSLSDGVSWNQVDQEHRPDADATWHWLPANDPKPSKMRSQAAFTLVELSVTVAILLVLASLSLSAGKKVYESASLAVSANNIRQLAAGGINYLSEHNQTYWPYKYTDPVTRDVTWWFGLEKRASQQLAEGQRDFDAALGPLGGYIPKGLRPDPSFSMGAAAFKPKYRAGYIGIGYNSEIGGGMREEYRSTSPGMAEEWKLAHNLQLPDPAKTVIFATCAQVNTFQPPASSNKPMLEEFYAIDRAETTVHFRHGGKAMVSFADGNAGFLPMEESTQDTRSAAAKVGRFAPRGSLKYLR